jgi:hypothetical protein
MAGQKASLDVVIPDAARQELEKLAKAKQKTAGHKVYAGDIVREALQEYFDKRGVLVRVDVDRGGYRRGSRKTEK